ncbi:hypothetical protein ACFQWC_13735 [Rossellomorea sp. GCM10028870]|uniref:hypothetical protein n=1 Tax=Rossellomorea sp. GCM10028870 TaxID=3273426 RepID=UPI00361DCD69
MRLKDAEELIQSEKLENYCFFCNETIKEGIVVIEKEANEWIVYTNNERATKKGEKRYKAESEALLDFIERLRGDKAMRKYNLKNLL